MGRADLYFHQDGMYYYITFDGDVPTYVERDLEKIEARFGEAYERRVPDGGSALVGEVRWGDGSWSVERRAPSEIGPGRYPSYDEEHGAGRVADARGEGSVDPEFDFGGGL